MRSTRWLGAALLLCGAPFAAVDLNARRGLTIVVSTHDLNMASSLCRDLILLDRGRVLAAGPVDSMMRPDLIRQLYDVDVDISTHPRTGHLTVVPVARADVGRDGQ